MEPKLHLDLDAVERARQAAQAIALDVDRMVAIHTTVAVERTVLRLFGVDGVDSDHVPLPNVVVDHLMEKEKLGIGAAPWIINAVLQTGESPRK